MTQPAAPGDASLLEIPLGSGLDESTDDAFTPATKCRLAQNVVFPDPFTAKKRPGLTTLATLANAQRLIAHDDEVLVIDGETAWSYLPSEQAYVSRGPVSPCVATRDLFASGGRSAPAGSQFSSQVVPQGSIALDQVTGYRVQAWTDGISIITSVFDTNAGVYVQGEVTLNAAAGVGDSLAGYQPRVVIANGAAFVIYFDNSFNTYFQYQILVLSNIAGGWSAKADLAPASVSSYAAFDVCTVTVTHSGAPVTMVGLVIYNGIGANVGAYVATTSSLTAAGGTLTPLTITYGYTTDVMTIAGTLPSEASGPMLAIAWGGASLSGTVTTYALFTQFLVPSYAAAPTGGYAQVGISENAYDTTSTTTNGLSHTSIGMVRTGVGTAGTAEWCMVYTRTWAQLPAAGAAPYYLESFYWQRAVSNGGLTTLGDPLVGFQTMSKPYMMTVNGVAECVALALYQDGNRLENGSVLIEAGQTLVLLSLPARPSGINAWTQPTPMAVAAPRFAGNPFPQTAEIVPFSSGLGFVTIGTEQDEAGNTSLTALSFDFLHPGLWQTVRLGSWTWIAGGLPMIYDGSNLVEVGFIHQPPTPAVALAGATGSGPLPVINPLSYVVCYAQQDVHGNIHRSPPSNVANVNNASNYATATLGIPTCRATLRQVASETTTAIGANPIRIEVYRNNSGAAGGGQSVMQLLVTLNNDPSVNYLYYVDTIADGANAASPELYTFGGGVASDGPPSLTGLAVHADRIVGVSEDGLTAYFTTALIRGEAPRFTDAFTITWPEGPITMQWSLEQQLHAATRDTIFFVTGNGPNDNGSGSDITLPALWQEAFGCVDPRGFALFQGGAVLSTMRGVYLEDRSWNFTWLGERFQRTLAASPTVTSVTPLDSEGAVRISLSGGPVVHWDFRRDKIATHIPAAGSIVSSVVAGGVYYALTSSGQLLQESATTCLDSGSWVTATIETGWMHPAGMQGWARLHRLLVLGSQTSPTSFSLSVARDYSPTFDAPLSTWTDTDLQGLSTVQVQATASVQKGEAFSFLLQDAAPATLGVGTGAGLTWKTLLARLRGKTGEYKQLAAKLRR